MILTLHNLQPAVRRKPRKRVGRGNAAGQGTYAGRGLKGQHARTGGGTRPGFEGGRTTLILQTPKMRGKGFKPLLRKEVSINVDALNIFGSGETVTLKSLIDRGIVSYGPVKILGAGELSKKLTVKIPVSSSARAKIEKAGGEVTQSAKQKVQNINKLNTTSA